MGSSALGNGIRRFSIETESASTNQIVRQSARIGIGGACFLMVFGAIALYFVVVPGFAHPNYEVLVPSATAIGLAIALLVLMLPTLRPGPTILETQGSVVRLVPPDGWTRELDLANSHVKLELLDRRGNKTDAFHSTWPPCLLNFGVRSYGLSGPACDEVMAVANRSGARIVSRKSPSEVSPYDRLRVRGVG
ncbi:MAG TPA: hypothetical protein VK424_03995 [Thermoplasmata archaeon]|nr:hypothetical protein [Thermoplasmata archaeon]